MKNIDRTKSIGGSDAPGVLGLSRWSSPLKVWAEKTGQVVPGELDNEAIHLGRELEDYVARRFTRLTGKQVRRVNQQLVHPDHPFITGHIDRRVVGEDALLECKTASAFKAKEWEGEDIPQEYIIQVMHYLAITGMKYAYIAVLIGNHDYQWKRIDADPDMIESLIQKEVAFWSDYVLTGQMPIQITAIDSDILSELFPDANPETIVSLEGGVDDLINERENINDLIKSNESRIDEINNTIKAMLGENETGETDRYKVTWKNQQRVSLDTKALKQNDPELFAKYSRTNDFRILRINKKKGAK
jgi:putative phage-type endonuclease